MKIALLRPKMEGQASFENVGIQPPMGLGYLSSFLKKHGCEVEIIDGFNETLDNSTLVERSRDAGIVGINCLTILYPGVIDLSKKLKEAGKTVILGGPHASNSPEKTLAETGSDYLAVGESEELLLEVIRTLEAGRDPADIQGVYTKSSSAPVRRSCPMSLDELPFPDWEQMDPRKYRIPSYRDKFLDKDLIRPGKIAPVLTSRGCKMGCAGCGVSAYSIPARYRSAENVVNELEYLKDNYGVEEFHLEDLNITSSSSHFESVCNEILRRNFKTEWGMSCGVDTRIIGEDLIKLAGKSGCIYMGFRIGSADPDILRQFHADVDLFKVASAVEAACNSGIITVGDINMSIDRETPESLKNTIDFLARLPLKRANIDLVGSKESPGPYYSLETLIEKLENELGKKMWLSIEIMDKPTASLYDFSIYSACRGSVCSHVIEEIGNKKPVDDDHYYMTGEINFSDGTKPEFYLSVQEGRSIYIYEGLDVILKCRETTKTEKAIVDSASRMGSIFLKRSFPENMEALDEIVFSKEGYREVKLENIPVKDGMIIFPAVRMNKL